MGSGRGGGSRGGAAGGGGHTKPPPASSVSAARIGSIELIVPTITARGSSSVTANSVVNHVPLLQTPNVATEPQQQYQHPIALMPLLQQQQQQQHLAQQASTLQPPSQQQLFKSEHNKTLTQL